MKQIEKSTNWKNGSAYTLGDYSSSQLMNEEERKK
jgi:hypothetical protein